jgi:nicotinamide-nucleotide amidase
VLICGGLGPTTDDVTSEAVARALARKRVLDEDRWARLRGFFLQLRGIEPPPGNEKQVMFPEGAIVLDNDRGTAPGYVLTEKHSCLAVLPGPPRENRPMFENVLLPWLEGYLPDRERTTSRVFRVFGLGESEICSRLSSLEAAIPGLRIGYRFSFPEILVKLRCAALAESQLEPAAQDLYALLEGHVYGTGHEGLAAVLGRELARRGLRIVTAESCTGGLAAKLLTDTPGSSSWMDRAFVSYSDRAKEEMLGVPRPLLEEHGAVSEPVARAMLNGALARSQANVGLAVTGIAGPDGGTAAKPVGTVCIAWGDPGEQEAKTYQFHWDREYNRIISAWAALHRVLQYLLHKGYPAAG